MILIVIFREFGDGDESEGIQGFLEDEIADEGFYGKPQKSKTKHWKWKKRASLWKFCILTFNFKAEATERPAKGRRRIKRTLCSRRLTTMRI